MLAFLAAHWDVVFLDEVNDKTLPMNAKGVGELDLCAVGAAIANPVYNATNVRVCDDQVTLEKELDRLPSRSNDHKSASQIRHESVIVLTLKRHGAVTFRI